MKIIKRDIPTLPLSDWSDGELYRVYRACAGVHTYAPDVALLFPSVIEDMAMIAGEVVGKELERRGLLEE